MPTVPEAEARRLLDRQLICEDATVWLPRNHAQTLQIQAGLMDEAGLKTELFIKLSFKPGLRTSDASYTFSVFRMNSYGLDRVYQLYVSRASKRETDAHRKPHEHFGSLRSVGSAAWQKWGYDEVLARFCTQTKIVFMPAPPDPKRTMKGWNCHEQPCRYVWEQLPGL